MKGVKTVSTDDVPGQYRTAQMVKATPTDGSDPQGWSGPRRLHGGAQLGLALEKMNSLTRQRRRRQVYVIFVATK